MSADGPSPVTDRAAGAGDPALAPHGVVLLGAALFGVALAWRLLLSTRTPVPSEDGVSYLWMAQRFAHGDWRSPLAEVFPPLLPLLMAPASLLQFDLGHGLRVVDASESFGGGIHGSQFVLAVLGAAAVLPVARLAQQAADGTRRTFVFVGLLAALPALPARFCAEIYTEPAFAGTLACAALAGLRGRFWWLGVWSGLGFWLRSEAMLLPLAFAALRPRAAWRGLVPAAAAVALLAMWRGLAGHGFDPLPKLAFNLPKAAVGADTWARSVGAGLLEVPGAWLEAFGATGVLAVFGLWQGRQRRDLRPFVLTVVLAVLVVLAFAVRRRFLVAWWPLAVVFATVALVRLPRRMQAAAVVVGVALGVVRGLRTTDADRLAERGVGAFLSTALPANADVVTDFTRVVYFAGRRPLPPRHRTADEMIAAARAKSVRWLVLGRRRPTTAAVLAALPEFAPVALPAALRTLVEQRGLEVRAR